eukprot:1378884-Rhodomonas_salina.1
MSSRIGGTGPFHSSALTLNCSMPEMSADFLNSGVGSADISGVDSNSIPEVRVDTRNDSRFAADNCQHFHKRTQVET